MCGTYLNEDKKDDPSRTDSEEIVYESEDSAPEDYNASPPSTAPDGLPTIPVVDLSDLPGLIPLVKAHPSLASRATESGMDDAADEDAGAGSDSVVSDCAGDEDADSKSSCSPEEDDSDYQPSEDAEERSDPPVLRSSSRRGTRPSAVSPAPSQLDADSPPAVVAAVGTHLSAPAAAPAVGTHLSAPAAAPAVGTHLSAPAAAPAVDTQTAPAVDAAAPPPQLDTQTAAPPPQLDTQTAPAVDTQTAPAVDADPASNRYIPEHHIRVYGFAYETERTLRECLEQAASRTPGANYSDIQVKRTSKEKNRKYRVVYKVYGGNCVSSDFVDALNAETKE